MAREVVKPLKELYSEVTNRPLEDIRVRYEVEGKDLILSPELAALFFPDSTGRLRPIVNTSGEITEVSASGINNQASLTKANISYALWDFFGSAGTTLNGNQSKVRQVVNATLVGGSLADLEVVPKLAGWTGCLEIVGIWSDTAFTATITPQDEDDADINPTNISGGGGVQTDLLEDHIVPFGASGANNLGRMTFYGIADEKALELDISGGGGTEKLAIFLYLFYRT